MTSPLQNEDIPISSSKFTTRVKNALKKNGIKNISDFEGKYIEDLDGLKGLGGKSIYDLRQCLEFEYKIKLKKRPKGKDETAALRVRIVEKLIKPSILKSYNKQESARCWAHNMSVAKRLVKKYPEESFWETFELGFFLNTLTYFFKEDGEKRLSLHFAKRKLANVEEEYKEKVVLSDTKHGEDYKLDKKPQSLKDFLRR